MKAKSAAPMMKIVSRSTCLVRGVFSTFCPASRCAMCPTSEPIPVVVTRISPWPRVTLVFMNAMPAGPDRTSGSVIGLGRLLDRHALTGESALLDLERGGDDHPAICRYAVTCVDEDDVAGHDLLGGDLQNVAVAPHLGDRLHHRPERRRCSLGLAFLVVSQPCVEEGQQRQSHRGAPLIDQQADDRRDDEHDLHVVAVVLQELLPGRLRLLLGNRVRVRTPRAAASPPAPSGPWPDRPPAVWPLRPPGGPTTRRRAPAEQPRSPR